MWKAKGDPFAVVRANVLNSRPLPLPLVRCAFGVPCFEGEVLGMLYPTEKQ